MFLIIENTTVRRELQDVFTPNVRKGVPRRVYIRRGIELQECGYTEGCAGCEAAKTNSAPNGHTEECRARIEAVMTKDASERVEIARRRCAKGKRVAGDSTAARKHSKQKRPRPTSHTEECVRHSKRKLLDDTTTAT